MFVRVLLTGFAALLIACCLQVTGGAADEPGHAIFDSKCSHCHGAEGRGAKAPRLVPFIWNYEQTLEQVRRPTCDMPPMPPSEVSDDEIAQVVAYLKTIQ
jgi:mono/diheme cytochrome c family protein